MRAFYLVWGDMELSAEFDHTTRDAWLHTMQAVGLGMTVGGAAGFASVSSRETSTSPLRPLPRGCVTGTAPSRPRRGRSRVDRPQPLTSETAVRIFRQMAI